MKTITDPQFWRGIGWALFRTALAGIVPFIPGLVQAPQETWLPAVATLVPLLVVAIATSLKGLADPTSATWPVILASRFLRQAGQFASGFLVGAVVMQDIDWTALWQGTLASALSTLVLTAMTLLPQETATPAVVVPGEVVEEEYEGDPDLSGERYVEAPGPEGPLYP